MNPSSADVVVVGAGPAGWAVAAACAGEGLEVQLVAPTPDAPWVPTYGCWPDELEAVGLAGCFAHRFDEVTVHGGRPHSLGRVYGVVDNELLRGMLVRRATGVHVRRSSVRSVTDDGRMRRVELFDGSIVAARAVVDASGHDPVVVSRPAARRGPAVQAAAGLVARFDRPPVPPGSCMLMDWRPVPGANVDDPTFLYTFGLGDGWYLVEETSLAAAPSMSQGALRRRLEARLAGLGLAVGEIRERETVAIPMGLAVPRPQATVGFGGAASLVHPATGYSLAASLILAPRLAAALAPAIRSGRSGSEVASDGWESVWPAERRRVRRLQEYGLGVLLRLDQAQTAAFFDTFFELPPELWRAYLDPLATLREITTVMRELFRAAPWTLRSRLATGDLRQLLGAAGLRR